ncbi:unnamed protein product [Ophioblennius macclurei]
MEESEVCSLPGGLASVRKQFETQETASSHSVTQFHFHHRAVQESSSSEVTVSSSRQVIPGSQQLNFNQEAMVSYSENNLSSSYENHQDETEEEFPRYTTKELRDRFERSIEEAAPQKPIKCGRDINRSKWSSNVTQNNTVASEVCEISTAEATQHTMAAVMDFEDFPPPPADDSDYLPPPPPDLLQMPSDREAIPECYYSPEPPEPVNSSKYPPNKDAYFKQRSMYELKRLYKHIHPEVRKNIEKECYIDYNESDTNHKETQEYMYERDDGNPDGVDEEEYGEWEEILPGDVQGMRWMFENKPLDTIKDDIPEDDEDDKKIIQQEMILGKDVRRTAWMFETKPMDALGSQNINSTEYKNKFNKFDKGDVRAAAWLFETQTMDTLNKMHKQEDLTKEIVFTEEDGNATIYMIDNKVMESLGHTETIDESHLLSLRSVLEEINGEVKTVTSTFDTQFKCFIMGQSSQMLEIKSVRKIETELENSIASRWLFDTQPLDMENTEHSALKLVCSLSMEDNNRGDWGRWLFEIKTINSLSEWESSQMEKKEIVGADVRKHCLVFETQPMDSLKDDSNARPQSIEDVIGGNVRSARHFFESSPQIARKNLADVGKLKKAELNEEMRGDVRHQKWRFESQPLEHIREEKKEIIRTVNVEDDLIQEDGTSCKADVRKNCWVFETQPMDTLKDDSNAPPHTKEEIIAGNVRSARNYFETIPSDELKELAEVGKLKKTVALDEEKGDVRHQKWRFESHPLEHIREEKKEVIRTIDLEEIDKVDVSNYKQIFESTDVSMRNESQKILIEGVTSGAVKSNKNLFESTPLYAMQDSSGHFHEVKTVRREEVVKGDVTTCKWMFETRPIDQFDQSIEKYQVIQGISKQEVESGDVKTAKWLFETQPLDAIKYFSNIEDEEVVETSETVDVMKGDVKSCKWLFETKPMDVLYERAELKGENEVEEMRKGDVKTCTWLFETQALDTIHDETETVLKTCTVNQEDIEGKDVRMACFLFETEKLENLVGEEADSFKRVTEIDIASGDVSRMKYIFENQTSDIMTSTSEESMQLLKRVQTEDIQKGNVVNCKWLFENQSIDTIRDSQEESVNNRTVNDVQGGDVNKGRFIFETCSLDKIHEVTSEMDMIRTGKITRDEDEKGDVRNYTMMFETQPLYAIQDKEGHYHEVTTVTSEEVTRGDVVGARWLFETKPLDAIKDTDEVYIIKSVTQQDVQKGDVMSAKWKFETQPLDQIAEENRPLLKTVEDIQGGNVKMNKHRFETDDSSQGSVKTVNVSEIQKGDVRTAKWRFETQSIDKIRSMSSENLIETVQKEEVAKGDVKQSVWLFEKNPLDHIKETDEDENTAVTPEEIPKADVKTTTWLFETTPLNDFNESRIERTEIMGKSIKGTLEELYSQKMVKSKGILIETDEIGDVRMAKYQLMNQEAPEIQREEVIRGDLQTIMMNLLNRNESKEQQIVIDSEEKGNISSTVQQLFSQERSSNIDREEVLRGDIQEAITNLFGEDKSAKHGILIQEDERGDVRMTIYSLMNQQDSVNVEKEDIVKGDIRSALKKLSSEDKPDQAVKIRVDDAEKGNVTFYSTCIESGALDYLKQLHVEPDETQSDDPNKMEIIGGDIKGTKLILGRNQTQIERTVEDVIPGDVHNTVKAFMTEPALSLEGLQKEEIVKGDLRAALNSLSESVNQTVVLEKEEVVKGNIPKTLRCLEKAQKRYKEVEKPDIIPGNIKGALRSLEESSTSRVEAAVEDLVSGDVKATLKSLELAKTAVREVEKEEIVRGNIHTAMQSLHDASSERRVCQQEIDVQGNVRGTIQLLMDTPSSPKLQRSSSCEEEVKGDVKMSIKSLYETQEQSQLEKEEVIKGDVKGTIKSLMETAQRVPPKVKLGSYRRSKVKQSPPVKNLNVDADRNIQKMKTTQVVESSKETHLTSNETEINKTISHTVEQSTQQTVVQHKTITQNHGIKTVKTEFRNLKSNQKGMIKQGKTKVKTDAYVLKSQTPEPDLPLPPPPPPVTDVDLPPPPTPPPPPPPSVDIDQILPPPPPLTSEQDFLPPPPSQQELESMPAQAAHPSPAKAKKMTVKKVKGPALHPVPKLESKVEVSKTQQVEATSEKVVKTSQSQIKTTTQASKIIPYELPPMSPSPQPLKKVYINPVKFTPPPSPPPFMRGKMTKFNTPLIKAEEKFRKLKEENTPPTTPTPPLVHDSVVSALEMLSAKDSEQSNYSRSEITQARDEKTGLSVHSQFGLGDSSKLGQDSNVNVHQEKVLAGSAIISSAQQQIVANETSKVVSVQKTSTVSSVRQETHSTTQKTVSVSSKQSAQSAMSGKVQTSISAAKTEIITDDTKKQSDHHKAKGATKSEDKKEDKTLAEKTMAETIKMQSPNGHTDSASKKDTSKENIKESKSEHCDDKKKTDHSSTKGQESASNQAAQTDSATANTNGKSGKANQKSKKSNKQEKQAEIKMSSESERQSASEDYRAEVKETAVVKVIDEAKEVKTELKPEIKKVTASPPPASVPTVTVSNTGSQPETHTATKKKKKSKKSKGAGQLLQSKEISTDAKTEAIENKKTKSEKTHQAQETVTVSQIHQSLKEERIQVKREVITTESKDDENSQRQKAVQKHVKGSQKREMTVTQQSAKEPPEESGNVPITVTGESEQNELLKSTTERKEESQRQKVQVLISRISEIQKGSTKADSETVKSLLSTIPHWLMTPERKSELLGSVTVGDEQRNEEILSLVWKLAEAELMLLDNEMLEKHECEPTSEKTVSGAATPRISKISIGSAKVENQTKKKTSWEKQREEASLSKLVDLRAPSPLLRMRSPSPTFITIESTRRTNSPQRVTPSPTLLHRPPTPPTPPPRRCDTPTSRLNRITPSPTFDKAENLPRLKDATAKLSRGVTPPPLLPNQIPEKKSEIVESPRSFHRQIKIESQVVETSGMLIATEKPKKSLYEEAWLPDVNNAQAKGETDILKDLNANEIQAEQHIRTASRQSDLGPDETSDVSGLSAASVREKREFYEEARKAEINKIYVRKEPIAIPERLGSDTEECEAENENAEKAELPRADMSSLVNKFESPEEKMHIRKELTQLTERLHSDTEKPKSDDEKERILEQEMPTFDIQAIKNVFKLGEQSFSFMEEKKDQEELVSSLSETTADTSKGKSRRETKGGSRHSSPLPPRKTELETAVAEPSGFSETKSITEHFSDVDEFGNKVTGTRTTVTEHAESASSQRTPFSYADAVKKKNAAAARRAETYDEDATERLLRNFHETWSESESVFKSLGYTVSEESSQVSHQTMIVSSDPSAEVGALHSMSEESLPDGCADSGQKKVP